MTFPDAKMRHCDRIGKGGLAMTCATRRRTDAHEAGFRMPTVTVYRPCADCERRPSFRRPTIKQTGRSAMLVNQIASIALAAALMMPAPAAWALDQSRYP